MDERYEALLELQKLDAQIDEVGERLAAFGPQLEELETPVVSLERELAALRARIEEMQQELRRLERGAEEKRATLKRYEERLQRVRNPREEAAARTEVDLISRAADADENDALELMDQLRRTEIKADELAREAGRARGEVEPRKDELMEARQAVEDEAAVLRDRRENHTIRMDPAARRLYERVRAGRTNRALATLTPDGACGHCFGVVPLQQQTEIQRAEGLVRCEACGVILFPAEE